MHDSVLSIHMNMNALLISPPQDVDDERSNEEGVRIPSFANSAVYAPMPYHGRPTTLSHPATNASSAASQTSSFSPFKYGHPGSRTASAPAAKESKKGYHPALGTRESNNKAFPKAGNPNVSRDTLDCESHC